MSANIKLWYNAKYDQLGVGGEHWGYICLLKFVPFATLRSAEYRDDGADAIKFVPHEIAEITNDDWAVIGDF